MCNKLKISKLQVLFGFIFCFFLSSQSHALMKNTCSLANSNELSLSCQEKTDLIVTLNKDFEKIYSLGSTASLSQPPLVIVPKVSIETPKALTSKLRSETITSPKKKPVSKIKNINKNKKQISDLFRVLDAKGSYQLGKCLKKLSAKNREEHFPEFKEEFATLEKLSQARIKSSIFTNNFFFNTPSKRKCVAYLDFILMAS